MQSKMRFTVQRWYVVPIFALVTLYVTAMTAMRLAPGKIAARANQTVVDIYRLAAAGSYDEIARQKLMDPAGIHYLKQQEALFGRIRRWNIEEIEPLHGNSWQGAVSVSREKIDQTDSVSGMSSYTATVEVDMRNLPYDSQNGDRGVVETKAAAHEILKDFLTENAKFAVKSTDLELIGDDWLATVVCLETDNGKPLKRTNYVVISRWTGAITQVVSTGGLRARSAGYADY